MRPALRSRRTPRRWGWSSAAADVKHRVGRPGDAGGGGAAYGPGAWPGGACWPTPPTYRRQGIRCSPQQPPAAALEEVRRLACDITPLAMGTEGAVRRLTGRASGAADGPLSLLGRGECGWLSCGPRVGARGARRVRRARSCAPARSLNDRVVGVPAPGPAPPAVVFTSKGSARGRWVGGRRGGGGAAHAVDEGETGAALPPWKKLRAAVATAAQPPRKMSNAGALTCAGMGGAEGAGVCVDVKKLDGARNGGASPSLARENAARRGGGGGGARRWL